MKRASAFLGLFVLLVSTMVLAQSSLVPSVNQPPRGLSSQQPASLAQVAATPQGNPDVKVWVNTASGVYHCPGSRWYGNTKRGEYMTQKQAQERGYRPAYEKVCR